MDALSFNLSFQSLIGIKGDCNTKSLTETTTKPKTVSIPDRD